MSGQQDRPEQEQEEPEEESEELVEEPVAGDAEDAVAELKALADENWDKYVRAAAEL